MMLGDRLTCFATNSKDGRLADLEPRHRRRARFATASETPATPTCGTRM
ncbi:hypothetical protein NRF20_02790 [Streptomyces sp. R-74717]